MTSVCLSDVRLSDHLAGNSAVSGWINVGLVLHDSYVCPLACASLFQKVSKRYSLSSQTLNRPSSKHFFHFQSRKVLKSV